MIKKYLFLFAILLVAGCLPQGATIASEADDAEAALLDFLRFLNTGRYEDAVPLYGGEYEALQVFNPEIDPFDRVALWKWVCEKKLLQCLEVRSAALQHQEGDTYVFQVEFNNLDGTLFVLGPCCGADETEMPPESRFEFSVTKNAEGRFVVLNTPPYVP